MRYRPPDELRGFMERIIAEVSDRDAERHRLERENEVLRGMLGEFAEVSVALAVLNHVYHRYLHHFQNPQWRTLLDALGVVVKRLFDGEEPTIEEWRALDGWPAAITLDSTTLPDVVIEV